MKFLLTFPILVALFAPGAQAQFVEGAILDEQGKALAAVNLTLMKAADSTWVRSELSTASGQYHIACQAGVYLVLASINGYEPQYKACTVTEAQTTRLDFKLLPKAALLGGVTVVSKAPYIEAKPGMMLVNVESSPASAGSNALDLLQRSPGVQVDPQGNISMKGKNGVQVYVDGRPSRLSGDQLTSYLRSMTAEEIAQLELITQPGAKYEAAGTAGIINIRTRAIRKQGLNGNLSSTLTKATEYFGNLSGRITYRRNKLTLYASEYYNHVNNHNYLEVNRRYLKPGTDELTGNVLTRQDVNFISDFHRLKAGGEYAISKQTTIGLRAQVPIGHPQVRYTNFTALHDEATGSTSYNLGRRDMDNRWHEKEFGVLGRHRFQNQSELSFDGFFVNNQGRDHGLFINEATNQQRQAMGAPDLWDISFPVYIRLISGQTDYNRTLGKETKLETGVKYTNVAIDYSADYKVPDKNGVFVNDTLRSTRFRYDEGITAAYVSASRSFNTKLEAQAGLRAEHTSGKGLVTTTGETFTRNYLSLFPTLFASYQADSLHTITFSYGRRLDRPNYHILNPARNYIDKYSYSVGNPRLMPQFLHNVEIGYSYKGELTATLHLMRADGIISDFFVQDDQTQTAYEIHDNIEGYNQCGLSVNYHKELFHWWTTNLYGDFYYKVYQGNYYGLDYNQSGSTHSLNMNHKFALGHRWNAELSTWYQGRGLTTVFTRPEPLGSLDIAVAKKLLSDSLIIKLAFNDVLGTQRYYASNRFANFDTDVHSTWDARRAVLSINYNFGKNIELMQRKGEAERRM